MVIYSITYFFYCEKKIEVYTLSREHQFRDNVNSIVNSCILQKTTSSPPPDEDYANEFIIILFSNWISPLFIFECKLNQKPELLWVNATQNWIHSHCDGGEAVIFQRTHWKRNTTKLRHSVSNRNMFFTLRLRQWRHQWL